MHSVFTIFLSRQYVNRVLVFTLSIGIFLKKRRLGAFTFVWISFFFFCKFKVVGITYFYYPLFFRLVLGAQQNWKASRDFPHCPFLSPSTCTVSVSSIFPTRVVWFVITDGPYIDKSLSSKDIVYIRVHVHSFVISLNYGQKIQHVLFLLFIEFLDV